MHASCSSSFVLFPLLYVLFAQTAVLPTTTSFDDKTLLVVPIANASRTTPAVGVAPVPISSRSMILAFLNKGQPIPESEVKDTLIEADQVVTELARDHPTQHITNDRFEYRRLNGNMLISIGAKTGETITWKELKRILQALYRFMTGGMGAEKTHYQELEFEVEAGGQEKPDIGLGLVWYFSPTDSEVRKRASLLLPVSSMSNGDVRNPNHTFPQPSGDLVPGPPNTAFVLPGAIDVQETTTFPIPRTSLSLSFYFFGPPIPAPSVQATLQGAMAKIRPFLNGASETKRIENDAFRWILPLSRGAGIPVAVTVFTYHGHEITWRQLFDVLYGLYAFTTTFNTDLQETHYQLLGFRILDQNSLGVLGVGGISYFRSRTDQLAKRVQSINSGMVLRRPSTLNVSMLDSRVSRPIVYPVADTNVKLTFTFLGNTPIPPGEVYGALSGAQQKISRQVEHGPDIKIPGTFRYTSTSGLVSTNVLLYTGKFITWKEMENIFSGLWEFCQDDQNHDRVLVFEIDIEGASRGRVGFATLLYVYPDLAVVENRALAARDTTLQVPNRNVISHPSLTTLAVPTPYPVPGTPFTLSFNNFGPPIPYIYANAAFTSAIRKIQIHVTHHPNDPIPNGRWESRGEVTRVRITVVAYSSNSISWQELSLLLAALQRYMTEPETEAEEQRCRDLIFLIDEAGEESIGYGGVVYVPSNRDREQGDDSS